MYFQSSFLYLGSSTLEECQNRSVLSILILSPVTCILQIDITERLGLEGTLKNISFQHSCHGRRQIPPSQGSPGTI